MQLKSNRSIEIQYVTEADLRDGLVKFAYLHGWNARAEYPLAKGWGSIDLVVWTEGVMWAVELKKSLTTQSAIRAVFEQAERYRRKITIDFPRCLMFIAAPDDYFADALAKEYEVAYDEITLLSMDELMGELASASEFNADERSRVIADRVRHLAEELRLQQAAATVVGVGKDALFGSADLQPPPPTTDFDKLFSTLPL